MDLAAINMLYEYGKLQFSFGAYEPAALYLANYRVLVCVCATLWSQWYLPLGVKAHGSVHFSPPTAIAACSLFGASWLPRFWFTNGTRLWKV